MTAISAVTPSPVVLPCESTLPHPLHPGKGISQIVRDVYLSVVDNYRAGDSVFLLGYSRGAAAAWEMACILDEFGVPRCVLLVRRVHGSIHMHVVRAGMTCGCFSFFVRKFFPRPHHWSQLPRWWSGCAQPK